MKFKEYLNEASQTIHWIKPDLKEELGEYFENEYTKKFLKSRGISFKNDNELLAFLRTGKMTSITKEELSTKYDNLTLKSSDFDKELSDPDYSQSFNSMEKQFKSSGTLTLPSPIILKIDSIYYGYAGNRRMNLAFKHNQPLTVWLVIKNEIRTQ